MESQVKCRKQKK